MGWAALDWTERYEYAKVDTDNIHSLFVDTQCTFTLPLFAELITISIQTTAKH